MMPRRNLHDDRLGRRLGLITWASVSLRRGTAVASTAISLLISLLGLLREAGNTAAEEHRCCSNLWRTWSETRENSGTRKRVSALRCRGYPTFPHDRSMLSQPLSAGRPSFHNLGSWKLSEAEYFFATTR
ncbi:hypothetical protein BDN71DRAFT_182008 [Pleurotus eryngii]|uniref:Uncharacterized protein n=1 Tax=Pleurotus eryngii TaxID=5323 RepID=A0A9P6A3K5_PLEER|nr:hypothetical protein BDN71DRAFT_182008 [Pleurotus eryngii]